MDSSTFGTVICTMQTSGGSSRARNREDTMSKGVRWDENNLEVNDQNRSATMKIDEPPTPFNFEYCDEDPDDDEEQKGEDGGKVKSTVGDAGEGSAPAAGKPKAVGLSFAEQWEKAGMDEIVQDPKNLKPAALEAALSKPFLARSRVCARAAPEEEAEAKRKFEENRKKHYMMSEALGRKVGFDEEDEDEDEQDQGAEPADEGSDDAEAKETKRLEFAKKRKAFYQEKDREAAERAKRSEGMESDEDGK
eukprot:3931843-Rhodomonas_salina.3